MEKLQAALENARRARTKEIAPEPFVASASKRPKATQTDALWAALPAFDLPEKRLREHRVMTRSANPAAVPFDILRTKVLLQMRQNGWKRLAITSPMPKAGKTTIACNLALSLARQQDMRSILMDLDLRDPSIAEFFEAASSYEVSDVLTGKVDFADQALRFGDNLACAMSHTAASDPARVLLADETAIILDGIERRYEPDIMIFDTPSILMNDDARAILKNVDCALIVVRAEKTRYRQFDTCEREVSELTNVLGTTLNAYKGSDTI